MTKSSKRFDQSISNFLFQILLDLTWEFQDLIYTSVVLDSLFICSLKISFTKLGLMLLRVWKISINKALYLRILIEVFPGTFNNSLYELLQSLCKSRSARFFNFSPLRILTGKKDHTIKLQP